MGGARKNEAKLSRSGEGLTTSGPNYSPSDTAHFERLADFPSVGAATDGPSDSTSATSAVGAFEYTKSDAREFDRLMGVLSERRGTGHSIMRGTGAEPSYSDADKRLFDELMSSDRLSAAAVQASDGGAEAQAPSQSAFQYSQQDLDAFEKIMPDASAADGGRAPERSGRRSRPDRDVGYIKIVDFDKEHAQRKESKRRSNVNIKVRYFD